MSSHAEIGDNHIEEKRATENVSILSSLNVNESSMCAPRAESRFHFCFSWHYLTRCDSFLDGIEVKLREMIDYECRKLFHFSFEIAIINAEI